MSGWERFVPCPPADPFADLEYARPAAGISREDSRAGGTVILNLPAVTALCKIAQVHPAHAEQTLKIALYHLGDPVYSFALQPLPASLVAGMSADEALGILAVRVAFPMAPRNAAGLSLRAKWPIAVDAPEFLERLNLPERPLQNAVGGHVLNDMLIFDLGEVAV